MTRTKATEPVYRQLLLGLSDPVSLLRLDEARWDKLLPLARSTHLFSRLAALSQDHGLLDRLPTRVVGHMEGVLRFVAHRKQSILWELRHLERVLRNTGVQTVVLKGTGYLIANLVASRGRIFGDIDLLTPRSDLAKVEGTLRAAGWTSAFLSNHDERYYREWMHEIPAMRHPERQIEVDIHHTISPLTARIKVDAGPIFDTAVSVEDYRFGVPSPADMVLHSALHLFYGGEFDHGLRDLSDLDLLLREFSESDSGFWQQLTERSERLKLQRPLFYCLRYTHRFLGTPVPEEIQIRTRCFGPKPAAVGMMDALIEPALMPADPAVPEGWAARARSMLWIRSHVMKMPPGLLVYHMTQKLRKSVG